MIVFYLFDNYSIFFVPCCQAILSPFCTTLYLHLLDNNLFILMTNGSNRFLLCPFTTIVSNQPSATDGTMAPPTNNALST